MRAGQSRPVYLARMSRLAKEIHVTSDMQKIAEHLLSGARHLAIANAVAEYPFEVRAISKRRYTDRQKMETFFKDGFIDRYSGERLFNPGFLRLLHYLMPEQFPFHPHGKSGLCHDIFWDLLPSIDHKTPIYRGGEDQPGNWVTTSMKRNSAKGNWTIEDLGWNLQPRGAIQDWDGLSRIFVELVERYDPDVGYVKSWYRTTKKVLGDSECRLSR